MRPLLHAVIALLLAEPGRVRVRDVVSWWLTTRVPAVRRIRCRWADRGGRPGWRPSEYR